MQQGAVQPLLMQTLLARALWALLGAALAPNRWGWAAGPRRHQACPACMRVVRPGHGTCMRQPPVGWAGLGWIKARHTRVVVAIVLDPGDPPIRLRHLPRPPCAPCTRAQEGRYIGRGKGRRGRHNAIHPLPQPPLTVRPMTTPAANDPPTPPPPPRCPAARCRRSRTSPSS